MWKCESQSTTFAAISTPDNTNKKTILNTYSVKTLHQGEYINWRESGTVSAALSKMFLVYINMYVIIVPANIVQ